MGNTPEAVEAFKAGAIDFICTIEPYASALLNDVKGSVLLSNGVDIYGPHYTDCVLAARTSVIEEHPEDLKALIKGMLKAQLMFESSASRSSASWSAPIRKCPNWRAEAAALRRSAGAD